MARRIVMLEAYVGTIEMEAGCMVDMINQYVIPSLKAGGQDALVGPITAGAAQLTAAVAAVHAAEDVFAGAKLCRALRLEIMIEVRKLVDEAEGVCPANCWNMATYKELLFVDSGPK